MYIKLTYPCPSIGGPGNPSSYRNEVYSRNMYKYIATVGETCIWSIYIFYLKSRHSDKQSNSFWVKWLFKENRPFTQNVRIVILSNGTVFHFISVNKKKKIIYQFWTFHHISFNDAKSTFDLKKVYFKIQFIFLFLIHLRKWSTIGILKS